MWFTVVVSMMDASWKSSYKADKAWPCLEVSLNQYESWHSSRSARMSTGTFYLLQGPPTPQTSSTRNTASPAERSRYSSRLLLDIGLPPFQSRSYRVYQMPCITGALSLLLMECLFIAGPFVPLLTAFLYLCLLACICKGKRRHLKFHEISRKDTVLPPISADD